MGGASYPKPDGERRNRAERQLDWTMLPFEGRAGDPPALPKWRDWTEQTLEWWAELWSTPQATRWDPTGRSMHTMALLHHELMTDAGNASKLSAEMRQHEDRHGLTPKAMLQLRWRVAAPAQAADATATVLSIVPDAPPRPDVAEVPAKRAKKADWVDWAVAWGADRSAAEKLSKAALIREFSSVSAAAPSPVTPGQRPTSKAAQRLRERAHR
jgi:hypothetical protein